MGVGSDSWTGVSTGGGSVQLGSVPIATVGSKRTQPNPAKYSSGQACMLCEVTSHEPSPCWVPGVNPTATRDGIPTTRAISDMAAE